MAEDNKFFVIDSSFILSYLLPDEKLSVVEEIFSQYEIGKVEFLGTRILPFEVFNGLWTAWKRKRIPKKLVKALGERFLRLYIRLIDVDYLSVSDLAMAKDLTFYDASYFYLSKSQKAPLLTMDQALQKLA